MKRDNGLNRIFFKKTIEDERLKYVKFKKILGLYPEFNERLINSNNLPELLELHKLIWKNGYRNTNLGPCSYGMFRCDDILLMTPDEVFLGNIFGLWTHELSFWEKDKSSEIGVNNFNIPRDSKIYDIIVKQYRRVLLSNLNVIRREASNYVEDYEAINKPGDPNKILLEL